MVRREPACLVLFLAAFATLLAVRPATREVAATGRIRDDGAGERAHDRSQAPTEPTLLDRAKAALAATDYRVAAPLFQQLLEAADAAGDPAATADALRGLAVAQWGLGDYSEALVTHNRALALSRSRHDVDGERTALN